MSDTCYMCEHDATTREHAPALCLFPKHKDVEPGQDFRKNLITVPSCEEHNSQKSKDDEYFLYTLVMCQDASQLGQDLCAPRLKRASDLNPSLLNRILSDSASVIVEDAQGRFDTQLITPDMARLSSYIDKLGRALYFHHFKRKWFSEIKQVRHFLFFIEGAEAVQANLSQAFIGEFADKLLLNAELHGKNPDIFSYRAIDVKEQRFAVMQLTLYGNAKITLMFV